MKFIKKATKSFIAGFDHRNPNRHTNLKCTFDSNSNAEGDYKPVCDIIRSLRNDHKFEQVVGHIEDYRNKEIYNGIGERLYIVFAKILTANIDEMNTEEAERTLLAFRYWVNRNPKCPYSTTALAEALNQVGWIYRGGGYAKTVTKEGWQKFQEYTAQSQEMMRYAQGLHSDHWYWNYISLRNVTEDQVEVPEVLRRYDRAIRNMPQSPAVYVSAVRPLLPRWGGNYALLEAFADQCAKETAHKFGDGAYAYIYTEIIDAGEDIRDLHLNRERFAKGCKDWLKVLPTDYLATAFASYAFLIGDHNLCLDLLESLDVFYENAYQIETALTFVNSVCRDETGR